MQARLVNDHEKQNTLNDRRREIVSELAGDLNRKQEAKLKMANAKEKLYNKHLQNTSAASKKVLSKYYSAFQKIAEATGLSDPQAIFNKYMNKDKEEAVLVKQRQEFQTKQTKLKRNQEKFLKSQSLLKDVKTGVVHLATMLNLGNAAQLEKQGPEEILKIIREKLKELRRTS